MFPSILTISLDNSRLMPISISFILDLEAQCSYKKGLISQKRNRFRKPRLPHINLQIIIFQKNHMAASPYE